MANDPKQKRCVCVILWTTFPTKGTNSLQVRRICSLLIGMKSRKFLLKELRTLQIKNVRIGITVSAQKFRTSWSTAGGLNFHPRDCVLLFLFRLMCIASFFSYTILALMNFVSVKVSLLPTLQACELWAYDIVLPVEPIVSMCKTSDLSIQILPAKFHLCCLIFAFLAVWHFYIWCFNLFNFYLRKKLTITDRKFALNEVYFFYSSWQKITKI